MGAGLASGAVALLTAVSVSRRRRTANVFLVLLQYGRGG
jgi:hypothetical protein